MAMARRVAFCMICGVKKTNIGQNNTKATCPWLRAWLLRRPHVTNDKRSRQRRRRIPVLLAAAEITNFVGRGAHHVQIQNDGKHSYPKKQLFKNWILCLLITFKTTTASVFHINRIYWYNLFYCITKIFLFSLNV